ncbi:hypothetical protein QQF64_035979 [Cirrhinus molitorella]|uniref:Protein kinase domain-containing protein n=1 Tax=Cirrhinus molitorella TaxID=172907 RepID=A0ABR3NHA2_9TELE
MVPRTTDQDIQHEILVSLRLSHPNIVRLMAAARTDNAFLLANEYIHGTTLDDALHNDNSCVKRTRHGGSSDLPGGKKPNGLPPQKDRWIWLERKKKGTSPSPFPQPDPFANPRTAAAALPQQKRDQSPEER